ncbi:UbiH/UbiF/VisC/COQ6 family ubiquinone biosynthesis hydroxylase [Immundisolibacter sp.]|uniref:UbiH/UbiF/VisC/COQ6 family ubiquinone biosynthesis hydroxylase n=1 Tax=Immundisolibacter sp. TaxID=1934948 RepID=UPI00261533B8|nr:UbiH/UbiF/VisC/COQ6 family ubiquinone biosynthesis hydroxylase [Immundisolibacter sp.]MDD3650769.1 UbiH/UbiF/VisC/COQ6 family ubiquinone biosynthesis hydroxylase [Immundisolibacter sp.]
MTDAEVLIVGAGITGAALALALADAGVPVALLDRATPPPLPRAGQALDVRVSAIHAAAAGWLMRLGAWDLIPPACRAPFGRIEVWDASSVGRIGFDSADIGAPWLGHIVENRALVAALHARLSQLPSARLLAPAEWDDWQVEAGGVRLRLADGRQLTTRLLVGADGGASPLRLRAGIAAIDEPFRQCALVCHVATERPHGDTARQRFLPTGPLAFLPLADGRSSIVWSTTPAEAQRLAALPADEFARELGAAFGERLGAIGAVGERAVIALCGREAARYVGPRLALAGDAAHVVHPLAGLGANLGLGDAAQLAAAVRDALRAGRDPGQDHLLRAYERTRRSQDLPVVRAIVGLHRLFTTKAPPLRVLRGAGLRAVDFAAPLKHLFTTAACGLDDPAFVPQSAATSG